MKATRRLTRKPKIAHSHKRHQCKRRGTRKRPTWMRTDTSAGEAGSGAGMHSAHRAWRGT